MTINDLSKELNITNRDLIDFLKSKNIKVSSHMNKVNDDMVQIATDHFNNLKKTSIDEVQNDDKSLLNEINSTTTITEEYVPKKFLPEDRIPCKSVTPWKLIGIGSDKTTIYNWSCYGDIDYVTYKDLQAMRKKSIIRNGKILIEDADLCYQWRRELGDTYKYFLGVEFPEEFFDYNDEKFKRLLIEAPDVVKDVIKYTAINMVRNTNYPTVQKLTIIDEVLGTCIKDFL